ncbi:MAG: aldehyde ferredoxin oxidoreductase C-terminal domain-containing protein [Candidatus Moduliflexus flocculans]|nr:aldehyde ferredoxin oxidoreductase C-terminal domain-containing protein [Candidatus Moduliflexus flocculans]
MIPPVVPERLKEAQSLFSSWKENPLAWGLREYGTPAALGGLNALGILPTRNFREGTFENADRMNATAYNRDLLDDRHELLRLRHPGCKRVSKPGERNVDPAYGGPEYETVGAFGPVCRAAATSRPRRRPTSGCNAPGLDTISTGMTVRLAHGSRRAGPHPGRKGRRDGLRRPPEGMLALVEAIASRQGIGDVLAEGLEAGFGGPRLRGRLPGGGEGAGTGPCTIPAGRPGWPWAAFCPGGADHMQMAHDTSSLADPEAFGTQSVAPLGILDPMDPLALDRDKRLRPRQPLDLLDLPEPPRGVPFRLRPPRRLPRGEGIPLPVEAASGLEDQPLGTHADGGSRRPRLCTTSPLLNLELGFDETDDVLPERLYEAVARAPRGKGPGPGDVTAPTPLPAGLRDAPVGRIWGVPLPGTRAAPGALGGRGRAGKRQKRESSQFALLESPP